MQTDYQEKRKEKNPLKRKISNIYDYRDEKGKLLFQCVRFDPKGFSQRRPDGKGGYIWNLKGIRRILYRLPKLKSGKDPIFISEGEKDVDNLREWNLTATCNPMGALKWKIHEKEYNPFLKDREIIIIPDNDLLNVQADLITEKHLVGEKHLIQVATSLVGIPKSIRILRLPDAKDFSDWKEKDKNNTEEKFLMLVAEAPDWKEIEEETVENINKLEEELRRREKKKKKKSGLETSTQAKFKPSPYARKILSQYKIIYDSHKRLWFYDKKVGIWKDNFEPLCCSILRKGILKSFDKIYYENEVIAAVKDLSYQENIPEEPANHLIPFKNGIYDMQKEKLLDFDSSFFFINKLGINYNPDNQECPSIDKLFREIVAEEDIISLYEIIAYCYFRGYPYPKCFLLYGNGANGKSTYCQVLRKIIGNENITSTPLNTILYNTFGTSELYGKLTNISPEMNYNILKKTDILKQLTGSDLVRGEKKFKDEFHFINYAKLIFLGNEIPYSEDKSFAFYRRMFLIEFANRFEIRIKADPFIVERIPEKEFEGLAFKCLRLLHSLSRENFTFTRHKRTEEIAEEYERISDPLGVFILEFTQSSPDDNIPVLSFNQEFKKYQTEKGLRVWNDNLISRSMRDKGYIKKAVNLSTDIKGKYTTYKGYLEIKWKSKNHRTASSLL